MAEAKVVGLEISGTILSTKVAKSGKVINSILVEDHVMKFLTDDIKYQAGEEICRTKINPFAVEGGFLGSEA